MTALSTATPALERHPTAQRVLDAAIDAIERGGEEALQVEPLVRELGLTVTAIYRWYGSRQALVQAAQQERYVRLAQMGYEKLGLAFSSASSPSQVSMVVDRMVETVLDPEYSSLRRRRTHAMGSAFGRPELMQHLSVLVRSQVDLLAERLRLAQRAGTVTVGDDPRSLALWIPAVVLGRVCVELDPAPPSIRAWNDICRQAAHIAIMGAPPTTPMAPLAEPPITTWSEPDLPMIPDHPTPQLLVALTIEMIDQYGEDGVKVEPLSRTAGLNVTTIYHWFGNRQGLIDVAQSVRFRRRGLERLLQLEQAVRRVAQRDDARAVVDASLMVNMNYEAVQGQLQRLNALGSAYARPALASAVGTLHHRDRRHLAGILRQLQVPGFVRADLDLEAFSSWMLGVMLGQGVLAFDGRPDVIDGVRAIQRRVVHQLLFGEVPPAP